MPNNYTQAQLPIHWVWGLGLFFWGSFGLEAPLPMYWVPVLKTLYNYILFVTQGPTIWVPGLLGIGRFYRGDVGIHRV